MENERLTEDARLPGEKREVFLSRVLLHILNVLCDGGVASDFDAVREALAKDHQKNVRKGRSRPGGYV